MRLRRDLVDRDAVLDVRARGLARVDAGQERAAGARVVARPVAERVAVLVREAGEDHASARGSGSSGFRIRENSKSAPSPFGVQSRQRDAVRHVGEGERASGDRLRARAKAGVIASSSGSARLAPMPRRSVRRCEVTCRSDGAHRRRPLLCRRWNGRLFTISSTSAEKR